jgi:hypothetical protein
VYAYLLNIGKSMFKSGNWAILYFWFFIMRYRICLFSAIFFSWIMEMFRQCEPPRYNCGIFVLSFIQGRAHPARAPPKIGNNMIFGVKSRFFTRNTQQFSRLPLLGAIFLSAPPNLKSWIRPLLL